VKLVALGSAAIAIVQSTDGIFLRGATEPVWMLVWGVALLFLASGAKSLFVRRRAALARDPHDVASVGLMAESRG
jgi:hypothetical protein